MSVLEGVKVKSVAEKNYDVPYGRGEANKRVGLLFFTTVYVCVCVCVCVKAGWYPIDRTIHSLSGRTTTSEVDRMIQWCFLLFLLE